MIKTIQMHGLTVRFCSRRSDFNATRYEHGKELPGVFKVEAWKAFAFATKDGVRVNAQMAHIAAPQANAERLALTGIELTP